MFKLGIIGTAGRREDGYRIMPEHFEAMEQLVLLYIKKLNFSVEDVTFVSGGAAWADHVAVDLHLSGYGKGLMLYLPCGFEGNKFVGNGSPYDPAPIANYYHTLFSRKVYCTDFRSRHDIANAIESRAVVEYGTGFKGRNTKIAKAVDGLMAFTFGEGDTPKAGGTKDTWDKCKAEYKVHIPLGKVL